MTLSGRLATLTAMVLAAVVGLTVASTAAAQVATDEPPRSALAEHEVFGFLPYWESAGGDGIDLETLTTLAWFGVEAGPDGRLVREVDGQPTPGWAGWISDAFAALRTEAQAAGVRVVLVVERFSWTATGRRATKKLLRSRTARTTLAREIAEVVSAAGADGVNLDLEPLPKAVRGEYVQLVRAVRRALDAVDPSLQLTFDLTPDVESFPLHRLVAAGAADAAVLMGYEYRTADSRLAGSIAPLRDPDGLDLRESVRRALEVAPASRVILALPWYGRAWSTRTREAGSRTRSSDRYLAPSTATYGVAIPRAVAAGRLDDRGQASAWSAYRSRACDSCPLSWRQLWYDDVDSVLAKAGLARRRGLRGVGIWALGYEDGRPELWWALRYAISRPPDEAPPTGRATVSAASTQGTLEGRPLVSSDVAIDLAADDGNSGSGVAYVRIATRGGRDGKGALKHGLTFPATASVSIALPGGEPSDEVFVPGATEAEAPAESVAPLEAMSAEAPAASVVIRVQWRDVAGNWSSPLRLPVWFIPDQ